MFLLWEKPAQRKQFCWANASLLLSWVNCTYHQRNQRTGAQNQIQNQTKNSTAGHEMLESFLETEHRY